MWLITQIVSSYTIEYYHKNSHNFVFIMITETKNKGKNYFLFRNTTVHNVCYVTELTIQFVIQPWLRFCFYKQLSKCQEYLVVMEEGHYHTEASNTINKKHIKYIFYNL